MIDLLAPIIELEFDKDPLNPHIIKVGKNIQLIIKKERPTLCERFFQFKHHKKFCRSNLEHNKHCTKPLQKGGDFCLYCKTGDKKTCEEFEMRLRKM